MSTAVVYSAFRRAAAKLRPKMTYNFDADAWYERELAELRRQREAGEIDESTHDRRLEELDARYDQIVASLDGEASYAAPK